MNPLGKYSFNVLNYRKYWMFYCKTENTFTTLEDDLHTAVSSRVSIELASQEEMFMFSL